MQTVAMKASLKYLANLDEPLVYVPSKGGGDSTDHVGNFKYRAVEILDGRRDLAAPSLDAEGFRLVKQETAVSDFYDDAEIVSTYHAEIETLLKRATGAIRVEIFDDTRRTSSLSQQKLKNIREPAEIIHNDYTSQSGIKRLRDHFADDPDTAEQLLEKRFAIVNVWRSIAGTVQTHPLALCDATSVSDTDLVSVERRADERIGEIQVALHNPLHRWYYFPDMQMNEALLVKTFDSMTDGRSRFTIHTSVAEPGANPDTPPRSSIETRCLLFFEEPQCA